MTTDLVQKAYRKARRNQKKLRETADAYAEAKLGKVNIAYARAWASGYADACQNIFSVLLPDVVPVTRHKSQLTAKEPPRAKRGSR